MGPAAAALSGAARAGEREEKEECSKEAGGGGITGGATMPMGAAASPPRIAALAAARALRKEMPAAASKMYGNMEGFEWWESHAGLFDEARKEYGMRCPDIYQLAPRAGPAPLRVPLVEPRWLRPEICRALADGSGRALRSVLQEVCRDSLGHAVYRLDLLSHEFCDLLLEELDHLEASGIPLRRPNGMNRYGAILSNLGFQEGLLEPLMKQVALPFARELWPEWVDPGDCDDTYGFVVRYKLGEDVDLAEHADTSNVTLNACLGREFTGGGLYFKGVRFTGSAEDKEEHLVGHSKGSAVLHLGGHFHGVHPLTGGERSNLVLWGTGQHGVVRIRPSTPSVLRCSRRSVS